MNRPTSIGGTWYPGGGRSAWVLTIAPSTRLHNTESHRYPLRDPTKSHCVASSRFRHHLDLVPPHVPTVYWREISGRLLCQSRDAILFHPAFYPAGAQPNAITSTACIICITGQCTCSRSGTNFFARRKRRINGQIQQITAGCVLAHSTPARPFHETAIYLYNHYRYL